MTGSKIDKVIEDFSQLSPDEKEYTADVIQKQLSEAKREMILIRSEEALQNFEQGKVKTGVLEDLHRDLEDNE